MPHVPGHGGYSSDNQAPGGRNDTGGDGTGTSTSTGNQFYSSGSVYTGGYGSSALNTSTIGIELATSNFKRFEEQSQTDIIGVYESPNEGWTPWTTVNPSTDNADEIQEISKDVSGNKDFHILVPNNLDVYYKPQLRQSIDISISELHQEIIPEEQLPPFAPPVMKMKSTVQSLRPPGIRQHNADGFIDPGKYSHYVTPERGGTKANIGRLLVMEGSILTLVADAYSYIDAQGIEITSDLIYEWTVDGSVVLQGDSSEAKALYIGGTPLRNNGTIKSTNKLNEIGIKPKDQPFDNDEGVRKYPLPSTPYVVGLKVTNSKGSVTTRMEIICQCYRDINTDERQRTRPFQEKTGYFQYWSVLENSFKNYIYDEDTWIAGGGSLDYPGPPDFRYSENWNEQGTYQNGDIGKDVTDNKGVKYYWNMEEFTNPAFTAWLAEQTASLSNPSTAITGAPAGNNASVQYGEVRLLVDPIYFGGRDEIPEFYNKQPLENYNEDLSGFGKLYADGKRGFNIGVLHAHSDSDTGGVASDPFRDFLFNPNPDNPAYASDIFNSDLQCWWKLMQAWPEWYGFSGADYLDDPHPGQSMNSSLQQLINNLMADDAVKVPFYDSATEELLGYLTLDPSYQDNVSSSWFGSLSSPWTGNGVNLFAGFRLCVEDLVSVSNNPSLLSNNFTRTNRDIINMFVSGIEYQGFENLQAGMNKWNSNNSAVDIGYPFKLVTDGPFRNGTDMTTAAGNILSASIDPTFNEFPGAQRKALHYWGTSPTEAHQSAYSRDGIEIYAGGALTINNIWSS